ncbi:MAG: MBL fold metallo-hydrolase [Oscillospiraceae bacterium]|nr:MBL fold metallo-hydrolase [Oscillospiraceae bacterium]
MLKFCSLYSSSSGNCLLVKSEKTNILIDAGVSCKKITNALTDLNINITEINAILVTHEHSDHISSLPILSKNFNIPIYTTSKTWDAINNQKIQNNHFFDIGKEFMIGDLKIHPFSIPHDAVDPCGFNIFGAKTKISIATDIGHMSSSIINHLKDSSFVFLEANHDPEILKCCSYPYFLKQRILGNHGHLSNNTAGQTISELTKHGLKNVMLGHLSKENNFPELAYNTVVEVLNLNHIDLASLNLSVASRTEHSELIDVS